MSCPLSWINEPMEIHIGAMLRLWEEKYRRAYEAPLARCLKSSIGQSDVNEVVKAAIILHDVGKLTEFYQGYISARARGLEVRVGGYRHELVSAAIAHRAFAQRSWKYVVSGAILLHHEPITMSYVRRAGERYVTLTQAYASLSSASKDGKRLALCKKGVELVNDMLRRNGFLKETIETFYTIDDLIDALKELVVRISLRGDKGLWRIRIAALVHVLTLLDALAAKSREGDEGGTFVSKRAVRAEVVELWNVGS